MNTRTVPSLIAGFILLIIGLIIVLHEIFTTTPTDETLNTWVFILIIGISLTLVGAVIIYYSRD